MNSRTPLSAQRIPVVKEEPASPKLQAQPQPPPPPPSVNARRRPTQLDLSQNTISTTGNTPATARPLTSREGLGIQDLATACLSPGFVTQDPEMMKKIESSNAVREQQRHLIEQRNKAAKGEGPDSSRHDAHPGFAARTPGMSRRNKAPPGLSIVAPSSDIPVERVIQSAPLGHTFTGLHNPHPLSRHIQQPSRLSNTLNIHPLHQPANQTNNRLPPIADVLGHRENNGQSHSMYGNQNQGHQGPLTSPGHPPPPPPPQHQQQHQQQQQQHHMQGGTTPGGQRSREYRSAEEAQQELAGGRPDLLPKLVHYSATSPGGGIARQYANADANHGASTSKRRRAEYEDGNSPPLGNGRAAPRRGPWGEGRDSPDTQRAKREEFLRICERAWDLFHS